MGRSVCRFTFIRYRQSLQQSFYVLMYFPSDKFSFYRSVARKVGHLKKNFTRTPCWMIGSGSIVNEKSLHLEMMTSSVLSVYLVFYLYCCKSINDKLNYLAKKEFSLRLHSLFPASYKLLSLFDKSLNEPLNVCI